MPNPDGVPTDDEATAAFFDLLEVGDYRGAARAIKTLVVAGRADLAARYLTELHQAR